MRLTILQLDTKGIRFYIPQTMWLTFKKPFESKQNKDATGS